MTTCHASLPSALLDRALDAGLRAEKEPEHAAENEIMALAANPGLDVPGKNVYQVAVHYSKLAGIRTTALRMAATEPWHVIAPIKANLGHMAEISWRSGLYDSGNGIPRRVVLVDRWSDEREGKERHDWRTLAESCILNRTIYLTAVAIGSSKDGKRHSPWTKCFIHPRNKTIRFSVRQPCWRPPACSAQKSGWIAG